jgi:sialate O-acetylesterase
MKKNCRFLKTLAAALAALAPLSPAALRADVKPNSLFHHNAVLQRGVAVPVWGTARDGETVTVKFAGQKVSTVAKGGLWRVRLKPMKASANPQSLTIAGDNTLVFTNLLVGDVWVCSGQSNMERQLGLRPPQKPIENWEAAAAAANYPQIRQYYVPEHTGSAPAADANGLWTICSPQTAPDFTAVGFFFARDVHRAENVPIGLLFSAWGGTRVEAWMSEAALKSSLHAAAASGATNQPAWPVSDKNAPSVLYNAMLAPLQSFPVTGVIWYQGESNNDRARQYRDLFPSMISDWRRGWGQGNFPFLFVQIAPFSGMSPEIREAQLLTLKKPPPTAMAVITDAGDADDIHPARKQVTGERLALAARALAYGEKIEYSGPTFDSLKIKGARAILSFTHLDGGLVSKDGPLKGFTIAGADKKFVPAKAEIKGRTVAVWSDEVPLPKAVRYGWANVPDVNLFNHAGLPTSPFRTDVD